RRRRGESGRRVGAGKFPRRECKGITAQSFQLSTSGNTALQNEIETWRHQRPPEWVVPQWIGLVDLQIERPSDGIRPPRRALTRHAKRPQQCPSIAKDV